MSYMQSILRKLRKKEQGDADTSSQAEYSAGQEKEWIKRLQAWWEGVEYAANETSAAQEDSAESKIVANIPESPIADLPVPALQSAPSADAVGEEDKIWPRARKKMAQQIWGEGFLTAGGEEFALFLSKSFSPLAKGMMFLDMNANIGGMMNVLSRKYGLHVEGYESSDALFRGGKDYLARIGAEISPLQPYNPEDFELKEQAYDGALVREILHQVENKEEFLKRICQSLKERGQILIVDYVLAKEGVQSKQIMQWIMAEPVRPSLWSSNAIQEALRALDMEVRIVDDITEKYIAQVSRGWKQYLSKVSQSPPDPKIFALLLQEVRLWAGRIEILKSGEVRMLQIYARKKPNLDKIGSP